MSPIRVILLVFAFLAACLAAGLVYMMTAGGGGQGGIVRAPQVPTQKILVAARELERGQRLEAEDIAVQAWPKDALPEGAIAQGAKAQAELIGRRTRYAMRRGEPLTPDRLIPKDGGGLMALSLRPGYRAYATKLTPEHGAGGFILPGDQVDIISARRVADAGGEARGASRTILRDIRVLAIGHTSDPDESGTVKGETITLEVTPRGAERLADAALSSKLSYALRGFEDVPVPSGRNESARRIVRVYRYGVLTTYNFDMDEEAAP